MAIQKNSDLRLELTSLMILRTITSSNLAYLVDSRSASFGGMINKDYDNCDVPSHGANRDSRGK